MSRPSWDDAPSWARYLTMDRDGRWYWHSTKPFLIHKEYIWGSSGNCLKANEDGWCWIDSLEECPDGR
jgi:hypothetical protein